VDHEDTEAAQVSGGDVRAGNSGNEIVGGSHNGNTVQARDIAQVTINNFPASGANDGTTRRKGGPVRRRPLAWAVSTLAAVGLVVTLVVVLRSGGGTPVSTASSTTSSGGTIGVARTADPCALADPVALAPFGQVQRDGHYGNFDRCDEIVQASNGAQVDVEIQLQITDPSQGTPAGSAHRFGAVIVVRQTAESGECDRTLLLPDDYQVVVMAKLSDGVGQDLCGMADAATTTAVGVLNRGVLPRRTLPTSSLAWADACGLLDAQALARIPGVRAANHDAGFADWECHWSGTDSSVMLRFDQNPSLAAPGDGTRMTLGGYTAYVQPGGDGGNDCVVQVPYRSFTDEDTGQPAVEVAKLVVAGSQPSADLCKPAEYLAAAAMSKLPRL
jgi:hypothetical protein